MKFLDMYEFLSPSRKEARILIEGGPLLCFPSNLRIGQDEGKLAKISSDGSVCLCPDGKPPSGIIERISSSHNNFCGLQIYEIIHNFPMVDFVELPTPGDFLLLGARHATAVKILRVVSGKPVYRLISVDPRKSVCSFKFSKEYRFDGRSLIYK